MNFTDYTGAWTRKDAARDDLEMERHKLRALLGQYQARGFVGDAQEAERTVYAEAIGEALRSPYPAAETYRRAARAYLATLVPLS